MMTQVIGMGSVDETHKGGKRSLREERERWICLHRFNNPIVPPSRRARCVLPMKSTLMGTFT